MRRHSDGKSLFIVLAIFSVAMILVGSNNQDRGVRIVTVRVDGLSEEQMTAHIEEVVHMIEGIESFVIDPDRQLCTFRYQSNRLSVAALYDRFARFGIRITPINPADLEQVRTKDKQELISIKLTPVKKR